MACLNIRYAKPVGIRTLAILAGMGTTAQLTPEQHAVREGCGLLDRSERGKLALTGAAAKTLLQGQVTNDVEALTPGTGCYAAVLSPKGKMLGDLRILDTGAEVWLDTERSALQAAFNVIHRARIGFDAELCKRTLQQGLLSLVGPDARRIAGPEAFALPADEHVNAPAALDGIPVLLIVTDLGLDVVCDAEQAAAAGAALQARGAVPVPEAAVEQLRVERGRPRYGVDLDETTIPQEAGLNERAVSFTKGCYVGQETVARLYYKGKPNRHLRGLRLSAPVPSGTELTLDGRQVGTLGSVVDSPIFGPIGLALVRREAPPGTVLNAGSAMAEVVELPFATDRPVGAVV
jgi:tRNA-modifying protein YgfZ